MLMKKKSCRMHFHSMYLCSKITRFTKIKDVSNIWNESRFHEYYLLSGKENDSPECTPNFKNVFSNEFQYFWLPDCLQNKYRRPRNSTDESEDSTKLQKRWFEGYLEQKLFNFPPFCVRLLKSIATLFNWNLHKAQVAAAFPQTGT